MWPPSSESTYRNLFFQEDTNLRISATYISSRGNRCLKKSSRVDNCEEMSVMRKRFKCAVLLPCRRETS